MPALAAGDQRISTNRKIARFLDDRHPEPPLFPADRAQREAVEEAERWANETLQMAARRIALAGAVRGLSAISRGGADGRMGYLLYRSELARRLIIPRIGRMVFAVDRTTDAEVLADLPGLLDRIDGWIADGVLGGAQLNAADFMVAPSLALILYRLDDAADARGPSGAGARGPDPARSGCSGDAGNRTRVRGRVKSSFYERSRPSDLVPL